MRTGPILRSRSLHAAMRDRRARHPSHKYRLPEFHLIPISSPPMPDVLTVCPRCASHVRLRPTSIMPSFSSFRSNAAALGSVHELMDAERRLAELHSPSAATHPPLGREASLHAVGGAPRGQVGQHLLAAMGMPSDGAATRAPMQASGPLTNAAQSRGGHDQDAMRHDGSRDASKRLPWWAE